MNRNLGATSLEFCQPHMAGSNLGVRVPSPCRGEEGLHEVFIHKHKVSGGPWR